MDKIYFSNSTMRKVYRKYTNKEGSSNQLVWSENIWLEVKTSNLKHTNKKGSNNYLILSENI